MKNLLFSLLFCFPLIAFGQSGLEFGYSSFTGTSDNWEDAESLSGIYGQFNFKTGDFGINVGLDLTGNSEDIDGFGEMVQAFVILRVGVQYSISLSDSFSLNPGIKFGSYALAFDFLGSSAASGSAGFAIGVDAVYMFTDKLGLNIGIDHNIISEGQWDGDIIGTVEEYNGLSIRPGLKFYF